MFTECNIEVQVGSSRLISVLSVIACITALQSMLIFVVVILVVSVYHKRKDTPRALNILCHKKREELYEETKVGSKRLY